MNSSASLGAVDGWVKRKVTPPAGREEGGVKVTLRLCFPEEGGEEKRAGKQREEGEAEGGGVEGQLED